MRSLNSFALALVGCCCAVAGCASKVNRGTLKVEPVETRSLEMRALAADCGVVRHAFRYEYTGSPARLVVRLEARQKKKDGKHLEVSMEELLAAEGGAEWVHRTGVISVSYIDPITLPTPNALIATLQVDRGFRRMRLRVPALLSTALFPSYADRGRHFTLGSRHQLWSYLFLAFPETEQDRSSRTWDHDGHTVTVRVMVDLIPLDPRKPILPILPPCLAVPSDTQPAQD